jgi:hypothetical protein
MATSQADQSISLYLIETKLRFETNLNKLHVLMIAALIMPPTDGMN